MAAHVCFLNLLASLFGLYSVADHQSSRYIFAYASLPSGKYIAHRIARPRINIAHGAPRRPNRRLCLFYRSVYFHQSVTGLSRSFPVPGCRLIRRSGDGEVGTLFCTLRWRINWVKGLATKPIALTTDAGYNDCGEEIHYHRAFSAAALTESTGARLRRGFIFCL